MMDKKLVEIQNFLFDVSKNDFLMDGRCCHVGFVIVSNYTIDYLLKSNQFKLELLNKEETENDKESGYNIICLDMDPNDTELICHLVIDNQAAKEQLYHTIRQAQIEFSISREEAVTKTLETVMRMMNMNRKDIVASAVRKLCRESKAFAFIHNFEGYRLEIDTSDDKTKYAKDLSKDDRSVEVLSSMMECHVSYRQISCKINRDLSENKPRGTGKVLSLGDIEELSYDNKKDLKSTGRFSDVLIPVD